MLYSVKMRAGCQKGDKAIHISGAERLVAAHAIPPLARDLVIRAQKHSKGEPDSIHLRIEKIDPARCLRIDPLTVTEASFDSVEDGLKYALDSLASLGISQGSRILSLLKECQHMRGAMLVDSVSYERLEPDHARGIRATYMDWDKAAFSAKEKNHYAEALVLASKVASAPGICAELCISDDPDYVTGYVASSSFGYRRICPMKHMGERFGGRIFFFHGDAETRNACIHYLEKEPVLVSLPHENTDPEKLFSKKLSLLEEKHLKRKLPHITTPQKDCISDGSQSYINLSSNDYLGLANDIRLINAAKNALDNFGVGSGGSRLTCGNLPIHTCLEKALADFKQKEAAIVFATGYMANCGTISALCDKDSVILSDEKNHASIIDGCRLSGARIVVYKHNDMEDLAQKAEQYQGQKGFIVSDGVFSMDGDIVDLPSLLAIAREYGFCSMIDEAHATGVLGSNGKGLEEYFSLDEGADITIGTLSKALGSEGGFVAGSRTLVELLQSSARSFIFSTAPSPGTMAAAYEALQIISNDPSYVFRLQENIRYFSSFFPDLGVLQTPIIPIVIGNEEHALHCADLLRQQGIFVQAIRYPTVALGQARLRVSIRSDHSKDLLARAAQAICKVLQEIG